MSLRSILAQEGLIRTAGALRGTDFADLRKVVDASGQKNGRRFEVNPGTSGMKGTATVRDRDVGTSLDIIKSLFKDLDKAGFQGSNEWDDEIAEANRHIVVMEGRGKPPPPMNFIVTGRQ